MKTVTENAQNVICSRYRVPNNIANIHKTGSDKNDINYCCEDWFKICQNSCYENTDPTIIRDSRNILFVKKQRVFRILWNMNTANSIWRKYVKTVIINIKRNKRSQFYANIDEYLKLIIIYPNIQWIVLLRNQS